MSKTIPCRYCLNDKIKMIRPSNKTYRYVCPQCGAQGNVQHTQSSALNAWNRIMSQPPASKSNICFDCANACGGCPWSEYDAKRQAPRFSPIPGWTAECCVVNGCETYHIIHCPQFKKDGSRYVEGEGGIASEYRCEICGATYNDAKAAERCEKSHKLPEEIKGKRYEPVTANPDGYPVTIDVQFSDGTVKQYKA